MINTLTIDNFGGRMTDYSDGDINSGFSYSLTTFGNDPFVKPGNLTWVQGAEQIDSAGAVITDLIMAGKERVESGILYVYAIGHTGRLYKIQVNDPAGYNPNLDNPVLLATLASGSPTFTRGASMDFYGTTEKIYIGHDKGLTSIAFDGTGETVVGVVGSWTQTVPRPLKQFLGNLYIGNGSNIAELNIGLTITSYTKLSPGFPSNTQVRDLDVSTDGTYLQVVVSRLALNDLTSTTQDVSQHSNNESYIFMWNGTDVGYTSFKTFPSFSLTSNIMFGNSQYTFGYDQYEMAIFNPIDKIISATQEQAPLPNAITSTGNIVSWMTPLFYEDHMELTYGIYGSHTFEVGTGYWAPFGHIATAPETDIIQVPFQMIVSNFGQGSSSNGYANNIYSTAKVYFSTLETSSAPTTKYRFFKWNSVNVIGINNTPLSGAMYQTQNQLFSKKILVKEVRIYGEPWVANNSFKIDLIGSAGTAISGGSKTFTAGSNLTVGDDYAWCTLDMAPTYALGVLITNLGTSNHIINKIEIDYDDGGK